jgi:hypothetical protein
VMATCGSSPCAIYKEPNGYGHISTGATATAFTRQFYIHDPASAGTTCSSSDECGVTVEVYWREGQIAYSVVLTSEVTSTIR